MEEAVVGYEGMTFTVRGNTWDAVILQDVLVRDEYGLAALSKLGVKPGTIVDIGGHIGGFVAAAARTWPEAEILSFEALPANYSLLARNVAQFPHARAVNAAVVGASNISEVRFQCSPDLPNTGGNLTVPACGVGEVLRMVHPRRIDLLKLDCEGAEEEIVAGLEKLDALKDIGLVCGEWHGIAIREAVNRLLTPTHIFNNSPHPDPSVLDLGLFYAIPRNRRG